MFNLQNVHPLTDFLRDHEAHVARLHEQEAPEVLTVDGKAELVIQSAQGYQTMLDRLAYADGLAGLRKAYKQVQAGETEDHRAAMTNIRAEHGL